MNNTSLVLHPLYPEAIEARTTEPEDPHWTWATTGTRDWFVLDRLSAQGLPIQPAALSSLTYSTVWACVRYISQTIAALSWHVYQRQGEGKERLPLEDNIAWLLGMQASPEMTALDFRQVMLKDALLFGNGYAEIERNGAGKPWWFWRLDPSRVQLMRDDSNRLYYEVRGPEGGPITRLDPAEVFHLRGLGPDGLVGYSVISLARKSIELGQAQEIYGHSFFAKGPTPGGVLEVPGVMKQADREEMRRSFQRTYGGAINAGNVVVLTGGAKFTPLTMSNEDAAFLSSRTFQISEICRWFGVPPHKVSELSHATFSNIEHQSIESVQDCLLPWCRRLEMEADVKLFGTITRGRRYTVLDLGTLLRGDSTAQTETVVRRVQSGLMTLNEGRAYFDLNPVPDGDELLMQGAMVTLDSIVNPPEPPPPPDPQPVPEPEPEEEAQPAPTRNGVAK